MNYSKVTMCFFILGALLSGGCSKSDGNGGELPGDSGGNQPVPVAPAASVSVVYEANPLFFASDDCLKAVQARLDDIHAMGVNMLWLMPVNEIGHDAKSIGSPYCVSDYKAVNGRYGSLADLKALVGAAHGKGMKVILDWVANHTSWDNPWITSHPDWYTRDASGNIISPAGTGWNDVADLDYDSAAMREAMIDAMVYWMREADIDGFRCDHADGVPVSFWTEAISAVRKVKSDAVMLAESDDRKLWAAGFDLTYDWNYAPALQDLFKGKMTPAKFLARSAELLSGVSGKNSVMRYAVNHDVIAEKSPVELFGSNDATVAAYALTVMLGGTPLIYSGQEAGFTRKTPFINASVLSWDKDLISRYKAIGEAYVASSLPRGGEMSTYETGRVATFVYNNGDSRLVVMVNTSDNEVSVKVPITLAGTQMTDLLSGASAKLPVTLVLEPYEYKFFIR